MGASKKIIIEEGTGGGASQRVVAENAVMISGELTEGFVATVQSDGTIEWQANGDGTGKIINGDFSVAQTGTSFTGGTLNADDTYNLDQWYVLTEGSDTVDITQSTEHPTTGFSLAMDVETTGDKFGIAQILEYKNAKSLIGGNATFSFKAKVSNARLDTIKAAIVSWSGTADTVTSDIISAWGADGTTPTLIANATFENTPADLNVGTDWTDCTVTGAIDTASTGNIIVFVWSDNAASAEAGDILYVTDVQLVKGSVANAYVAPDPAESLLQCQRFAYKIGSVAGEFMSVTFIQDSTTALCGIIYPTEMRATPLAAVTGTAWNMDIPGGGRTGTLTATPSNVSVALAFTSSAMTAGNAGRLTGTDAHSLVITARL